MRRKRALTNLGHENDEDFKRLWSAQVISMAGTAVTDVALPLTFLMLGATSFEFGLLFAFKTGPRLFAALFASQIADRYFRRSVMIMCDLIRCFALATIPVAAALGVLGKPHVYVVSLILGAGEVVGVTASRAYLPSLVRRDALASCNARLEGGSRFAAGMVPGLAGSLIRLVAAPLTLSIDCLSYLCSAILLLRIRRPEPAPPPTRKFWPQLAEGWNALFADPVLRSVVISLGAVNFGIALLYTQLAHYVADTLLMSPVMVGLALATMSIGSLVGSFIKVFNRHSGASALAAGAVLCAIAGLLQGASGWTLHGNVVLVASFLLGVGQTMFLIHNITLRQLLTPLHLQGRINAVAITVGPGFWPIGALVGGTLGERIGQHTMFMMTAAYLVVVAIWILSSPIRTTQPA